jgi:hypothetical protein
MTKKKVAATLSPAVSGLGGTGLPQLGHALASSLISLLHSTQGFRAIE